MNFNHPEIKKKKQLNFYSVSYFQCRSKTKFVAKIIFFETFLGAVHILRNQLRGDILFSKYDSY